MKNAEDKRFGSVTVIRRRLVRIEQVASVLRLALVGVETLSWPEHERKRNAPIVARLGLTLLTKTALARRGYRLKQGARPVGHSYFGAPLSRWSDLYVLEAHAVKIVSQKSR